MNDIAVAIRNTRKRLGKTMAEFADMIGCTQSTVSRYESGRLRPSRTVLLLILQLAEGPDREVFLNGLRADSATQSDSRERDLLDALRTFEDYLGMARDRAARDDAERRCPGSPVAAFARAAKQVLLGSPEPDPALTAILEHWIRHRKNRKAHEYFRHVAAYLDVELTVLEAGEQRKSPVPTRTAPAG